MHSTTNVGTFMSGSPNVPIKELAASDHQTEGGCSGDCQ